MRRILLYGVSWLLILLWAYSVSNSEGPKRDSKPAADGGRYFPDRWEWQKKQPEEVGFDSAKLQEAVAFAKANEAKDKADNMRDAIAVGLGREPHGEIIGPTKDRGPMSGLITRNGYVVAEWGDTNRVDMTFSATKSYVATVAGLAVDRGLIRDVHDRVQSYVPDGTFDSPHNSKITWHHLLNQTSEWQGTLWDKPDWADRFSGQKRPYVEPGSAWTYNDVRVNLLAYALLHVWRKPLPQVLKDELMDPIHASPSWRWHGYDNSWVTIDGLKMQSVSGGGHWGGGLWISARDHARFGLLHLRRGKWAGKQILSEKWIDMATRPTPVKPVYGYMWWVNPEKKHYASAPESSFFAVGAGSNVVWVDPDHDVVAVVRWIDGGQVDGFIKRVLEAVKATATG